MATTLEPRQFKRTIKKHYKDAGRDLAWRRTDDPYRILVSEIMLQQTQVARVEGYYKKFIKKFPSFVSLAKAKKSDVLRLWQGLGYNRRALALQKLAQAVVSEYGGKLPSDCVTLESLPGIGSYTAGAIRAFAFNEPEVFIETNIRRVFIHFFFSSKRTKIHDDEIKILIQKTLDKKDPRVWYWALMDYGAMLGMNTGRGKKQKNPNQKSAHYAKQSKFSGSDRELRGKLLRLVLVSGTIAIPRILKVIPEPKQRIESIIITLEKEGFVERKNNMLSVLQ